ncbi:MAG: hypothetical protein KC454_01425 [Flavobacteriales bacterium]|nr:hypothetical protein [Flavobacteriales bacterium]
MKKINQILILSLSLFVVSCGASKYTMSDTEIAEKGYSIDGWNVMKNGTKVGTLSSTEWELYKNSFVREISVATSFTKDEDMLEIARFLHSKFPDAKIEVNEDSGNSFE